MVRMQTLIMSSSPSHDQPLAGPSRSSPITASDSATYYDGRFSDLTSPDTTFNVSNRSTTVAKLMAGGVPISAGLKVANVAPAPVCHPNELRKFREKVAPTAAPEKSAAKSAEFNMDLLTESMKVLDIGYKLSKDRVFNHKETFERMRRIDAIAPEHRHYTGRADNVFDLLAFSVTGAGDDAVMNISRAFEIHCPKGEEQDLVATLEKVNYLFFHPFFLAVGCSPAMFTFPVKIESLSPGHSTFFSESFVSWRVS
ncbi:hypothetical protein P152DRAFT_41941 [Eremomyces bilateralis CBS 781.70]|uniref:Uncharacterized protein n=1 Tax=Eremomyces bilateralis CBS 781.70 TaxID=1392243 RepID=A0A6G1G1L8_9PEZI|nr:uncharacterized protein P152DRAFT_41941 [Eremomyces bilateralis CBS 781.70]KAF1812005.1 hypothetical protein P152DRAFT_41941 [Eremomyces bilateralis CBS 781.70]